MKRLFLLCLALLGIAFSPAARASLAIHLDEARLFSQTERIVAVVCLGPVRTWTSPDGMRLYTEFAFQVEEEFRGSGSRFFSIVQPGGRLGRIVQKTWGYPEFSAGQRLVLFLSRGTNGPVTVGLSQGVFTREAGAEERLIQRVEGLRFPSGPQPPLVMTMSRLLENLRLYPFRKGEARP